MIQQRTKTPRSYNTCRIKKETQNNMQSGREVSGKFTPLCACQILKPALLCVLLTNTHVANKLVHVNCVTEATISLFVI